MALISNSSLHNWITFNETTWNNVPFPPCQQVTWTLQNYSEKSLVPTITNASCVQVCNDSSSLFGWQENLATCGLWSTLVYAYNFDVVGSDPSRYIEEAPVDLLSSFADVGLDADDPEYFQSAIGYADIMSACFVYLYQITRKDDGLVSGACTKNWLFPYSLDTTFLMPNNSVDVNFNHSTTALSSCLSEMCSPVTLNPELAGVGVSFFQYDGTKSIDLTLRLVRYLVYSPVHHRHSGLPRAARSGKMGQVDGYHSRCASQFPQGTVLLLKHRSNCRTHRNPKKHSFCSRYFSLGRSNN